MSSNRNSWRGDPDYLPTYKDQVRSLRKEKDSNVDTGPPRVIHQDASPTFLPSAEAVPIDDATHQPGAVPIAPVEPAPRAASQSSRSAQTLSRVSTSETSQSGKRFGTVQSTSDKLGNSSYPSSSNNNHKHRIWAGVVVIGIVVVGGVAGYALANEGEKKSQDPLVVSQSPTVSPSSVSVVPTAPEASVQTTAPAPAATTPAAPVPTPALAPVAPSTEAPVTARPAGAPVRDPRYFEN